MDLVSNKFYAELIVSGQPESILYEGSYVEINRAILNALKVMNVREYADGKTIMIRMSSKPLVENTLSIAEQNAKMDKELGLKPEDIQGGPEEGESYESFHARLLLTMTDAQATWFANDWFGRDQDPILTRWQSDPKVKQFNMINASSAGFARALPGEYIELKRYIIENYPTFAERIKWRTAF